VGIREKLASGKALESSQSLATITLLDTNVDMALLGANVRGVRKRVVFGGEGVYRRTRWDGNVSASQFCYTTKVQ
jgi:hypothetical protein